MKSCLFVAVFINFLYSGIFAGPTDLSGKKCDEYADFPEPPCCGTPYSLEGRINENKSTPILNDEVPYMLSVGGGIGMLINSRWALTCAHCIASNYDVTKIYVEIRGHGRKVEADFWIRHPLREYKPVTGTIYDIALVRLKEPFIVPKEAQPICLPLSPKFKTFDYTGKNVTVVGWYYGKKTVQGQKVNKAKAILPIRPKNKCHYRLTMASICTSHVLHVGDSGGPVSMLSNFNPLGLNARYIIGINSMTNGYTDEIPRVDAFIEWIKSVILSNKE